MNYRKTQIDSAINNLLVLINERVHFDNESILECAEKSLYSLRMIENSMTMGDEDMARSIITLKRVSGVPLEVLADYLGMSVSTLWYTIINHEAKECGVHISKLRGVMEFIQNLDYSMGDDYYSPVYMGKILTHEVDGNTVWDMVNNGGDKKKALDLALEIHKMLDGIKCISDDELLNLDYAKVFDL